MAQYLREEDLFSSDDSDDDDYNYLSALDNTNWRLSSKSSATVHRSTSQTDRQPPKADMRPTATTANKPVGKPLAKPAVAVKSRFNRNDSLLKDIMASEMEKTKDNSEPVCVYDKRDADAIDAILEESLIDIDINEPKTKPKPKSSPNQVNNNSNNSLNPKGKRRNINGNDTDYDVQDVLKKKKKIHEISVSNNNKSALDKVKNDRLFGKAFSPTVYSPEVPVVRGPVPKPSTSMTSTLVMQKALSYENNDTNSDYNPNRILSIILDWNIKWLTEFSGNDVPNTLSPFGEGSGLKTCYDSLEDYQKAYIPLILYETWAQLCQDYSKLDNREQQTIQLMRSPDITSDAYFMTLHLQTVVTKTKSRNLPQDGWLCLLEMMVDYGVNNERRKLIIFGYLRDMYCDKVTKQTSMLPGLPVPPDHQNPQLVKYFVQIAKKPIRINSKEMVRILPVFYLRPTMRQIELIAGLNASPLFKDILRPRSFTCQVVVPTNIKLNNDNFNESQNRAILGTYEALSRPYAIPKILFIQGPPGTGKTHTLVGIIKHIYRNWEQDDRLPRILICAPSNGAVDEIGRRLYMERQFLMKHTNNKHRRPIRIVRIGKESQIHPDMRRISFETLIKDNTNNETERANKERQERLSKMEHKVQKLDQELANHRAARNNKEITRCEQEMNKLLLELKNQSVAKNQDVDKTSKRKLRNDIMAKADIILSTLNSCHQHPIEQLSRFYSADTFDCVIVDEASQCSEPELLMPLYYKMTKMILIGDPMQLPATVISKKASSLQFGRSLFERFYHYFREVEQKSPEHKSPILMLTEQYRMHPQICHFPSANFYDGKLTSSKKLNKIRDFKLKPYIVFDVTDTLEDRSDPTNKHNKLEADFVIRLLSLIDQILTAPDSKHMFSVGVITPYNGQKNHLIDKLAKQNKKLKNIHCEINTVDGFQGQERDIIILSAVRAFDNQKNSNRFQSIGFLDSVQRMNVALTRAKYSMILCVSAQSLENDKNWKALMDDAYRRVNVRFKVPSTVKSETLKQMLAKTETIHLSD